jgi:hypothetical protein
MLGRPDAQVLFDPGDAALEIAHGQAARRPLLLVVDTSSSIAIEPRSASSSRMKSLAGIWVSSVKSRPTMPSTPAAWARNAADQSLAPPRVAQQVIGPTLP